MRIVHTNIGVYPERGGPPSVIVNLAAAQARAGHTVGIITAESKPSVTDAVRQMLNRISGGDLVSLRAVPLPSVFQSLFGSAAFLIDEPVDFVHIHELWNPFDAFVARSCRCRNIPYAVTVHGLLSPLRRRVKWLKKRLARFMYVDRMLRSAHFVQALTMHECQEVRSLVPDACVRMVSNGFSLSSRKVLELPRPASLTRVKTPFILFMSRLHIMKGVDLLVPAFQKVANSIPDLDLVIAGPNDGARDLIEDATKNSSVSDRIHLVGMVDGDTKNWLLTNAVLFLLPSRDEGFSVAILEALASGLPAVLTPGCHFPEAVSAGAALQVPLQPNLIAEALISIAVNPVARCQMSKAARKLATENYSWDHIAAQIVDCYQQKAHRP